MRALRGLQRDLQAFLLGEADAAERHVLGNERLSARERLRVYADAYRIRPRETLADDFKAVRAWLGPARFVELADAYIRRHPSRHYSLRWFGRHFARFLGAAPPWRDTPLLAELAAFEWALGLAFDAPDEPALTRARLVALAPQAWPRLRLRTRACVERLDLQWNAPAIRAAVDADALRLPAPARAGAPVPWVIWRTDAGTCFRSLEADEAPAFDAMRGGATFAEVCATLARTAGAQAGAARAAALLERWLAEGMLRDGGRRPEAGAAYIHSSGPAGA
jgi:hypothetical protein